jgi:hypothetical protein
MTLADRLLYLLTLVCLPLIFWFAWQPASQASYAEIHVNGKYLRRVNLAQDQLLVVHGELGDSVLEVKNGQIRFTSSPCTLKRCIHNGWIKQAGSFNACVPNKVSVSLSSSSHQKFDSINF